MTKSDRLVRFLRAVLFIHILFIPITIVISEGLSFLAVLLGLVLIYRDRWRDRNNPFLLPALVFAGAVLLSIFVSIRPGESASKLHHLILFGMLFALPAALRTPADVVKACWLFVAGSAVLAAWDVFRVPICVAMGQELFHTGNMRDPQFYMVALCLFAGLWVTRGTRKLSRRVYIVLGLLLLAGLVLHFKRGVWMATLCAFLFLVVYGRRWKLLYLVLGFAAFLMAVPGTRERILMTKSLFSVSVGGRYVLWTDVTPEILRDYPQGVGWCALQRTDLSPYSWHIQQKLDHLHSNLLQMAVELGWHGLAAWLLLIGTGFYVLLKAAGKGPDRDVQGVMALCMTAGLLALFVNGLIEYNFGDSEIKMAFLVLMGMGVTLLRQRSAGSESSS